MRSTKGKFYRIFSNLFRLIIILESIYFFIKNETALLPYCLLTFITTFIPDILYRIFKLKPSNSTKFFIQFFIFLSMFLGHINNLYHYIKHWDDILHVFSGFILGLLAYLVLQKFDKGRRYILSNKGFVAFFIIIFGIASAGIWEIFEYSTDYFLGTQSQGGSLNDTMLDIINGSIGPIIISIYYSIKG